MNSCWAATAAVLTITLGAASRALAIKPVPPPMPGSITLTAMDDESRLAERRLAQFVRALQMGRRQQAAALLSSRVPAPAKEALIQKRWLPARIGNPPTLEQILYWKDLQIRTSQIFRDTRHLQIQPRRIALALKRDKKRAPAGILEVRMRKEAGTWWVEMQPGRRIAQTH